jgi:Fic family protein
MKYNWQQSGWPEFKYNLTSGKAAGALSLFNEERAHITGMLKAMSDELQMDAILQLMVAEAIKTSEIEGEYLSRPEVLSSIRNNLGLNPRKEKVKDKRAQGIGQLMVAVRNTFESPLTQEILFEWHEMLLQSGTRIKTGAWRSHKEPMQVVSGTIGKEKIHFEASPSAEVPGQMKSFIKWFNDTAPGKKLEIKSAPLRAAVAHLYFESIHPFEDGNGRIGRAIAEKALSQTIGRPVVLSLSQTIEKNKKHYYQALERAQRSNEITSWIEYFIQTVLDAQIQAREMIELSLTKTRFFDRHKNKLNERQLKVVKKMLEAEPQGFKGGMTARKYISITRASKATATRDLQQLAEMNVLLPQGGGRSIHYLINI